MPMPGLEELLVFSGTPVYPQDIDEATTLDIIHPCTIGQFWSRNFFSEHTLVLAITMPLILIDI
jgi:hypothetical protein